MRVRQVSVSPGCVVTWRGRTVETGIFKKPLRGRVMLRRGGVEGDRQADLRVHGGENKAVYAYSADHYAFWRRELGRRLRSGAFGENLTIERLAEHDTCVGDVFQVGEALLQAVQPRLPCFKLGVRFDDPTMPRRFMRAGRFGVYFRVIEEGSVCAGELVERVQRDPVAFPVPALVGLLDPATRDPEETRRALACAALPLQWRETLARALAEDAA
jgi:MOSC domain-containing protein YiiM